MGVLPTQMVEVRNLSRVKHLEVHSEPGTVVRAAPLFEEFHFEMESSRALSLVDSQPLYSVVQPLEVSSLHHNPSCIAQHVARRSRLHWVRRVDLCCYVPVTYREATHHALDLALLYHLVDRTRDDRIFHLFLRQDLAVCLFRNPCRAIPLVTCFWGKNHDPDLLQRMVGLDFAPNLRDLDLVVVLL